jgi:hypothetical protein
MTELDRNEPPPPAAWHTAPATLDEPSFPDFPLDPWVRPRRIQRPLVGVSLWCFGALLWSYLVVGEIVVWTAVPEALGVLAVMSAFGLAWYRGTSQLPRASRVRILLPGLIAFCSWLVVLVMSSAVLNTAARKDAELTALLLWSLAASAYALGRHLTALNRVPASRLERASHIALWAIAGLATLMAGVNIISYV